MTGLAAGFGYNRKLIQPAVEKVKEFPLVKFAADTTAIPKPEPFDFKGYRITPLASFEIEARVLSRERLGVAVGRTVGVGNDYNDLDLLEWVGSPFVVSNAPAAMLARFNSTGHHDEGGFAQVVARMFQ